MPWELAVSNSYLALSMTPSRRKRSSISVRLEVLCRLMVDVGVDGAWRRLWLLSLRAGDVFRYTSGDLTFTGAGLMSTLGFLLPWPRIGGEVSERVCWTCSGAVGGREDS